MDITLLVSELREIPSFSTPVKELYDKESAIVEVTDAASALALMALLRESDAVLSSLITNSVDIKVMKTHAKVVKPFVSNDDLEDDFI